MVTVAQVSWVTLLLFQVSYPGYAYPRIGYDVHIIPGILGYFSKQPTMGMPILG